MSVGTSEVHTRSLVAFLALTFAVTWACFITAAILSGRLPSGAGPGPGLNALILLGTFTPSLMAAALVVSTWAQAGEEIGWRGYALPRLTARLGLGAASIVLGMIWAVWHLPLFYLHGADTYGQSFVTYLLQVTAISVAMAWLYWRTHGSLLLVMLMHASINNTKGIVAAVPRSPGNPMWPSASLTSWLGVAVLWTVAGYFLIRMRKAGKDAGL